MKNQSNKTKNWPAMTMIAVLSVLWSNVAQRVASASPAGGGASGGGGSPGQGGFTFGGGASGGSGASASFGKAPIFPINHERASVMPILPPGTDPFSAAAVQRSFDAGTLTNQQAFTMSRLDAPIWGQPMQGLTKEAILASPGGLVVDDRTRILAGPYAGQMGQTTDFGTPEAAQAALNAYFKSMGRTDLMK